MVPMVDLRLSLGSTLAADAGTLAPPTDANKVALIMEAFTPGENLVVADLTLATFATSTPLLAGTGTQQEGIDPQTGAQIITIKPPAGGWYWETTAGTNLPQTIYGYALLTNDLSTLLAVAALPTPINLTETNQEINLPPLTLTFVQQPMF